ncbi:MAG: hypothetical protein IH840_14265 [Candidatus Heimdallarchaeota archaeon]|nr:hypothetical protein [Candidatus Heimdallarchaeota archaeon]
MRFPLVDVSHVQISQIHESAWKLFKPNFQNLKNTERSERRHQRRLRSIERSKGSGFQVEGTDSVFWGIVILIIESILYSFRSIIHVIRKPAIYYKLELIYDDESNEGFIAQRGYSPLEMKQLANDLTDAWKIAVKSTPDLRKTSYREFISNI